MSRFIALDAVRFVAAMMVVLGHLATWPGEDGAGSPPVVATRLVYDNLIASGPAAVIVFFVISGFCIHYPFRRASNLPFALGQFYLRRYIRIGLPMLVVITLSNFAGLTLSILDDAVLWSLAAELVYYTLYPLVAFLRWRSGWQYLVPLAFAAAYAVVVSQPKMPYDGNYPQYGLAFNWVIGLPCWLLGCILAEGMETLPTVSSIQIWVWRAAMAVAVFAASFSRFHLSVSYAWTLDVVAVLSTLWLAREISYSRAHPPSQLLVKGGQWSYSLYLVHIPAAYVLNFLGIAAMGVLARSAIVTVGALLLAYGFFVLIERPSHHLARYVSQRWPALLRIDFARL